MTDFHSEFLAALTDAGYRLPAGKSIEADDRWHRLIFGNEKQSSGRYSLKVLEGGFAIGSFGSDKEEGGFHKWSSKSRSEFNAAERAEMRAAAARYKTERDRVLKLKQEKIGRWVAHAVSRLPMATIEHQYLRTKQVLPHGIRWRSQGNELVIPMYTGDGMIANVQRVPVNGWKGFWKGARVLGTCYPIGKLEQLDGVLIICEGFATGASIHEVTGLPVRVAFNTGNLKHVAAMLRAKYPDARIVFAADNDRWVFRAGKAPEAPGKIGGSDTRWDQWREEGLLYNPGVEKAQEAAASIGGAVVIWPEFENPATKPTDFNDLRLIAGDDAVRNRIAVALTDRPSAPEGEMPDGVDESGEGDTFDGDHAQPPRSVPKSRWPFKILGYDDGMYYFFPKSSGQIFSATATQLGSIVNLFRLAPRDFWFEMFSSGGKNNMRKCAELAADAMMQEAHDIGVFSPEKVRGVGAWIDAGRTVIHCGDELHVNNEIVRPHLFPSRYAYPLRSMSFPTGASPLSNKDAALLREICGQISWESKLSGDLLAGWIVIAPFCGALEWRPHIWVEGESESGKTTVIERIIRPMLDGVSFRFDGGTTEAAIRQKIGADALPVIYDEAEPENVKDRLIMDGLLLLARRASSGGTISKGGSNGKAESFNIRSCFCFAGINPAIKQRADESRISRLVIRRATFDGANEFYKELKQKIRRTLTRDYAHSMMARTLDNLQTLIANCETFTDAAADVLTSRRAADQIGPMLAGLYLLTSEKRVDYDIAVQFIRKHDWTMHTAIAEQSDPERLITYISTSRVKYYNSEMSIGALILKAYADLHDDRGHDKHHGTRLREMGIWVRTDGVLFSNKSPELERILKETPWVSWSRPLKDIDQAESMEPLKFATGLSGRSVKVPLKAFGLDEWKPPEPREEPPAHDDDDIPY